MADFIGQKLSAEGISKYIVGSGEDFTTIQAGLNAARADGGGAVYVREGTYNEDLTLHDGTSVVGAVGSSVFAGVTIVGQHTPPSSGTFTFKDVVLQNSGDAVKTLDPDTADLSFINVGASITGGYLVRVPQLTGSVYMDGCYQVNSSGDGGIEAQETASLIIKNSEIGEGGSAGKAFIGGPHEITGSKIGCLVQTLKVADGIWKSTEIGGSCSFTQQTRLVVEGCVFNTGTDVCINYTSSNPVFVNDCVLNTSATDAIQGTGGGGLGLSGIHFQNNSGITGSFTSATPKSLSHTLSTLNYTLPSSDGVAGQVMETDGSGTLSFATPTTTDSVYSAFLPTTDTDVTGNGTQFQLGSGNSLTIRTNIGNDGTTGGVYTAPEAGDYLIGGKLQMTNGGGTPNRAIMNIFVNGSVKTQLMAKGYQNQADGFVHLNGSDLMNLNAGDMITWIAFADGLAGDTVDIQGSSNFITYIWAHIIK